MILPRSFYLQPTKTVARKLLGQTLVVARGKNLRRVMIVETEAYLGIKDPACHSYGGRKTERVAAMYQIGGTSYVYFIYGMYFCLNVVTRSSQHPEAVLIRAAYDKSAGSPRTLSGPGKLCRELQITKKDNLLDLTNRKRLWIEATEPLQSSKIMISPRVGVHMYGPAADWKLRYCIRDHQAVSRV